KRVERTRERVLKIHARVEPAPRAAQRGFVKSQRAKIHDRQIRLRDRFWVRDNLYVQDAVAARQQFAREIMNGAPRAAHFVPTLCRKKNKIRAWHITYRRSPLSHYPRLSILDSALSARMTRPLA